MFGIILISVITVMHVYVFWRAASVRFVRRHVPMKYLIGTGVLLWSLFVAGRVYGHHGTGMAAVAAELVGMNWMATLFLIFTSLLVADVVTVFGFFIPNKAPSLRGLAIIAGSLMSLIALFQGLRAPVINTYDVTMPGLPPESDGTTIVAISDLHLGSLIGEPWLADRVTQIQALNPDLVVLLGDIFEGHGKPGGEMFETMKRIEPPLGLWFVQGNHESHHRGNLAVIEKHLPVLRDRRVEIRPGLILAGIQDLTRARRSGRDIDPITRTLADRPPGAVVLLSHTPWHADRAARSGVGLMLCGHTHGGQIWPFDYLVRLRYPLLEGRYEIDGMTVIVSRGAATWGPRMRLWHPGEILHITLRAKQI